MKDHGHQLPQQQRRPKSNDNSERSHMPSTLKADRRHRLRSATRVKPSAIHSPSPRASVVQRPKLQQRCKGGVCTMASVRSHSAASFCSSNVAAAAAASAQSAPTLLPAVDSAGIIQVPQTVATDSPGLSNSSRATSKKNANPGIESHANASNSIQTQSDIISMREKPSSWLALTAPLARECMRSSLKVRPSAPPLLFSVDGGSSRVTPRKRVECAALRRREQRRKEIYAWNAELQLRQEGTGAGDAV